MRARLTHILVFLIPALVALRLGLLAHGQALVDPDTVAAMGNAWRVFHWQSSANMSLIGFEQPPLMALLFVPLASVAPQLLVSGLAAPILGAIFLGLSVLIIWRLGRSLGLPLWLTLVLSATFALHPLVLSYAMTGSKGIVLSFVLLGLAASLVSWQREQRVRDVLTGSFFAAAAILLAYETILVVLAVALYLVACCHGEKDRPPAKAEGLLVAFLLPAAYVALVWVAVNWVIMGDPWHFWPRTPVASAGPVDNLTGGSPVAPQSPLSAALAIALSANPLLLALLYHSLRRKASGWTAPAGWMIVAALAAILIFPHLRFALQGDLPGSDAIPWVPLTALAAAALGAGWALLVAFVAQAYAAVADGSLRRVLTPGVVIILLGSLVLSYNQQVERHVLPVGVRTALRGTPAFARSVKTEWEIAGACKGSLVPGRRHLIFGREAYVVALRAEADQSVMVASDRMSPELERLGDLDAGSMLIVQNGAERLLAEISAMKPHLALRPGFVQGSWACYQLSPAPPHGQPSSSGAIIAPGAPDAYPRR